MTEVWTMGETMVSLRATTPLAPGGSWTTHVAGAESNVAIGLARLGHTVIWCSRLGDDAFGRLVGREIRAEGVSLDAEVDPDRPTGFMFLSPTSFASGVSYHRAGSAASAVTAEAAVGSLTTASPRVVVLSGITPALGPAPAEAVARIIEEAARLGATVVLDVNHRGLLWSRDDAGAFLKRVIGRVDVVVGSPEELELIAASPDEIVALGPAEVVVKLGSDGARLHTPDGTVEGPTTPVAVVDPVGAGDAFTAGYVSGMLDGLAPEARLSRGNLMGRAAVRHRGDYEGLPRRAELSAVEGDAGPADVIR